MTATGRFANTEGLGLGRVGVDTDPDGWVVVNSNLETTNPDIYAAGLTRSLLAVSPIRGVLAVSPIRGMLAVSPIRGVLAVSPI